MIHMSFAKQNYRIFLSNLSYHLFGNNNLKEERKTKRARRREQKETTSFCRNLSFLFCERATKQYIFKVKATKQYTCSSAR